ncbi:MAG: hydrogenase nickel incorporation protein HypB [Candidatus Odinarchaeota archaeon]
MSENNKREVSRIKELESINLSREEIRDFVIETKKEVEKDNDSLAKQINDDLKKRGIISIDIVGAIGAGKTALLEKIAEQLSKKYRILVICGDITTRVDANRIEKHDVKTIQINTGRECALNAYHIYQVLNNQDLDKYNLIFIENVGNLICPSDFKLGTDKRMTVVSITEGEWVVEKHPMLFKMSDIAVINKIDLLERLGTNINKMENDAKKFNPNIKVIKTSTKTNENIDSLIKTLEL